MNDFHKLSHKLSYQILCDHSDSEHVTSRVISWLSRKKFSSVRREYEATLRMTCLMSSLFIVRRNLMDILKVRRQPYEMVKPDMEDIDDYEYVMALELFMRASEEMTILQRLVFCLYSLEELSFNSISGILHLSQERLRLSYHRALEKVRIELRVFDRESDSDRYIYYIRKVTSNVNP